MNRRTWGFVATVVGSALGAWYWTSRMRNAAAHRAERLTPARDHGTVIFDNTPAAPSEPGLI